MKKIIIAVVAVIVIAAVFVAGYGLGKRGGAEPADAITTTEAAAATEMAAATTTAATTMTTATTTTATTSNANISEEGRQLLKEHEKYVIHGIVFEMDMEDVFAILGPLKGEPDPDDKYSTTYQYENIEIESYGNRVAVISVYEGTYMGLTVGKSTREDANRVFGTPHKFWDDPNGHGVSSYKDGVIEEIDSEPYSINISVHYQDKVITEIAVISPSAP